MNNVPLAMVFVAYDWDNFPAEYLPLVRALEERERFAEELSSIDEIDYGYICVARYGDVEFAFLPSSFIHFVRWAAHNSKLFCGPRDIFLGVKEEEIIFTCSGPKLMVQAIEPAVTEEWRPLFGRPLPYASSYELLDPGRDSEGRPQWPGAISRSITIRTRDWLEGVIAIGDHFRQLVMESRALIEENPKNYIDPDDADRIREAYQFCEEYPAIRTEIERKMLNL